MRYYWSYAGCPLREDWHLIKPVRPVCSPEKESFGPFPVPAKAGYPDDETAVPAPYCEWRPPYIPDPDTGGVVVSGHLCLMAMTYAISSMSPNRKEDRPGDNPKNRCNPDPIVYPWEPAWDTGRSSSTLHGCPSAISAILSGMLFCSVFNLR